MIQVISPRQEEARLTQLLHDNAAWIRSLSWQIYRSCGVSGAELDDYIHFGSLGFLEVIKKGLDLTSLSFKAYAYLRVRGHILNNIFRFSEVGAQLSTQYELQRERAGALNDDNAIPDSKSRQLGRLNELVISAAIAVVLAESPEPVASEPASCPYYHIEQSQLQVVLHDMIDLLSANQQTVIQLHYFQCLKFNDIAELLGLSRARVSQLHSQALGKIREWIDCDFSGSF